MRFREFRFRWSLVLKVSYRNLTHRLRRSPLPKGECRGSYAPSAGETGGTEGDGEGGMQRYALMRYNLAVDDIHAEA